MHRRLLDVFLDDAVALLRRIKATALFHSERLVDGSVSQTHILRSLSVFEVPALARAILYLQDAGVFVPQAVLYLSGNDLCLRHEEEAGAEWEPEWDVWRRESRDTLFRSLAHYRPAEERGACYACRKPPTFFSGERWLLNTVAEHLAQRLPLEAFPFWIKSDLPPSPPRSTPTPTTFHHPEWFLTGSDPDLVADLVGQPRTLRTRCEFALAQCFPNHLHGELASALPELEMLESIKRKREIFVALAALDSPLEAKK